MAEVINFLERVNKIKNTESLVDPDDDLMNAKIVSKEVFFETMMLLEDMGYDVNENPGMLKDLEALSFLSSALIFRAHNNPHPGQEMLDCSYEILTTISKMYETIVADNDNAKTDSTL
jgi:hypothetical protein